MTADPALENEAPAPGAPAPLVCNTPERPLAELNRQAKQLQDLLERAQSVPSPAARVLLQECLQAMLAFYGDGLARVMQAVHDSGAEGEPVLRRLLADPGVSGLLLIHGLHPLDLETRLNAALNKVRPYMESHGGNVELLGLDNGVARLRLQGTCQGCPSSRVTLELAVRQALEEACPDLAGFNVE